MLATTPTPPYYAVIFARTLRDDDLAGYADMSKRMVELVQDQEGFLGVDSSSDEIGITVSYWKDLNSIKLWRDNLEHTEAREKGRSEWYSKYSLRIAKVERQYDFESI